MGAGRVIARAAGWVLALAGSAVVVLLLAPDRFDLTTTTPFAQVIAFRGALGLGSVGAGLALLAVAGLVRLARRRRSRRGRNGPAIGPNLSRPAGGPAAAQAADRPPRALAPVAVLAVVLLVAGAVHLGILASRGVDNPPTTALDTSAVSGTPGTVTVLALNTHVGGASARAVADAAIAVGADVLALPETPAAMATEVAALLAEAGRPMQTFTNDRGYTTVYTTSLLVSQALGQYREFPTREGVGYVRAEPVDGDGPPVVAVHASAPTPSNMDWWLREVRYAVGLCRGTPGVIAAGDFNATGDHAPMRDLGRCIDATSAAGAGGVGTWPTGVPALLGAPIDHVLADGEAWVVRAAAVVEVGASDHRAVVARLAPRD